MGTNRRTPADTRTSPVRPEPAVNRRPAEDTADGDAVPVLLPQHPTQSNLSRPVTRHPLALRAQDVLALQRTRGNREVQRLLAAAPPAHAATKPMQLPKTRETPGLPNAHDLIIPEGQLHRAADTPPGELSHDRDTPEQTQIPLSSIEERFPLDVDEDGEAEQKRLFFSGEGKNAELMINPDPVMFKMFLKKQKYQFLEKEQGVKDLVDAIRVEIAKPLSQKQGHVVRDLLKDLAKLLQDRFNNLKKPEALAKLEKPKSKVKFSTRKIAHGGNPETVSDGVVAEPLSIISGGAVGTIPQGTSDFMTELRKQAPYIRGHMLNAKLHGPGEPENLVPISATFNKVMERDIETPLKNMVLGKNRVVSFSIRPNNYGSYTGGPSAIEKLLPDSFTVSLFPMKLKDASKPGDNADNWEVNTTPKQTTPTIDNKQFTHDAPSKRMSLKQYELNNGLYWPQWGGYDVSPDDGNIWEIYGQWMKQTRHRNRPQLLHDDKDLRTVKATGNAKVVDLGKSKGLFVTDPDSTKKEVEFMQKKSDVNIEGSEVRIMKDQISKIKEDYVSISNALPTSNDTYIIEVLGQKSANELISAYGKLKDLMSNVEGINKGVDFIIKDGYKFWKDQVEQLTNKKDAFSDAVLIQERLEMESKEKPLRDQSKVFIRDAQSYIRKIERVMERLTKNSTEARKNMEVQDSSKLKDALPEQKFEESKEVREKKRKNNDDLGETPSKKNKEKSSASGMELEVDFGSTMASKNISSDQTMEETKETISRDEALTDIDALIKLGQNEITDKINREQFDSAAKKIRDEAKSSGDEVSFDKYMAFLQSIEKLKEAYEPNTGPKGMQVETSNGKEEK